MCNCRGMDEAPGCQHIGTELHERMEAFARGEQIHDPEQDGTWDNWNNRTEAGELPYPRVEMREYEPPNEQDLEFTTAVNGVTRENAKTPEEMAEQLGVSIEELPAMLQRQIDMYTQFSQRMLSGFVPPKMNRAQRRARDKQMRRRHAR